MKKRKIMAVSVAVVVLSMFVAFGTGFVIKCTAQNYEENRLMVDNVNIIYSNEAYKVYNTNPYEVFPSLPEEAELMSDYEPTGEKVKLNWYTDGYMDMYGAGLKYTASFYLPKGYEFSNDFQYPEIYVTPENILEDYRYTITGLNGYTETVVKNRKYELPETIKGRVDGISGDVEIAVKWDKEADTAETGIKRYVARAVNSFEYKVNENGEEVTATVILNVIDTQDVQVKQDIIEYYKAGDKLKNISKEGYTLIGWFEENDESFEIKQVGEAVKTDANYIAILAKVEYLGTSFKIYEQGVRYGFVLKIYGLNDEVDALRVDYTDKLIKRVLDNVTFTAYIDGQKFEFRYREEDLKYLYYAEYKGYVTNLVFERIGESQLEKSVKPGIRIEIGGKTLETEGMESVIKEKAQQVYDDCKFGLSDKATIDNMAKMYGVVVEK